VYGVEKNRGCLDCLMRHGSGSPAGNSLGFEPIALNANAHGPTSTTHAKVGHSVQNTPSCSSFGPQFVRRTYLVPQCQHHYLHCIRIAHALFSSRVGEQQRGEDWQRLESQHLEGWIHAGGSNLLMRIPGQNATVCYT
jgi:hypothetical protein